MTKVGIIGYGTMGKIREKAIKANGYGTVVSVFDMNNPIDIGDIRAVESLGAIIDNPEIDVVFICTPNYLNKPLSIKCLQAGKHVFCEKPPAFNAKEVEEVKQVFEASGKKLMYGFNHRHHSSIKHMKNLIDSSEYGKILWMRGRYGKSVDKNFFQDWRAKKELAGGGIFLDQGIHMLDLFLYIGGEFDEVKSFVSNLYWKLDIEDNVFAILRNSETGMAASLHSTMSQWRHLFSFEVFLEKGYMVLNGLKTTSGTYGDEVLSIAKNRTTAPAATWEDEERITYHSESFWRSEIDHFMDAIERDKPIEIGGINDALTLMKMVDKVYENGRK
jgi:1,5-anhydro-D-fructose reductase (1,5-anhydro-D-mannitol-forming)